MNGSPYLRALKVGSVTLPSNLALAPMAGYGDVAMRRLCSEFGAGLTVTEMISVNGLLHGSEKTRLMLETSGCGKPSAVQLFGSVPELFYRALKSCRELDCFDLVDVNMGCPVAKIVRQGEGSALMKEPRKAAEIVRACVEGSGRPVSVKFRLGWEENDFTAESFACEMERAGASLLTVHGRTARQMYRGQADWNKIALTARAVKAVPVLGNGDVSDLTAFDMRMASSGVAGIAVGRGALGHPQLFAEITGRPLPALAEVIRRHIDYMCLYFPDRYVLTAFRKHLVWYLKGVPGARQLRLAAHDAPTPSRLKDLLTEGLR